jgi:hypothetical protein
LGLKRYNQLITCCMDFLDFYQSFRFFLHACLMHIKHLWCLRTSLEAYAFSFWCAHIGEAMSHVWLNLNSMAGEPAQAPASPTDSENVGITIGRPKVCFPIQFSTFLSLIVQGQFQI